MKTIQKIIMAGALVSALTINVIAQTNLQFTAVAVTDEQAIRLTWASVSNEVYQIQCANALNTNADGSTAWQTLYDDYPSQGTNTFVGDFGNYNLAPQILHPKNSPLRLYRILDEGQDSLASDEPTVSITSPTNGSAVTGELTIIVTAFTDQPVLSGTKLYVDGQEMRPADSTTNWTDSSTNYEMDTYSINTCEWGNEMHTLFATAESESGYGDAVNSGPIMTGHAVSPFVPVTFNNLVTRISFSQPFFNPAMGQTQQVSAVFAANSDWTLNIVDVNSNVVRTATGSGTSMLFNWDGTGTGETNLPVGVYHYYITAQTNGEADEIEGGGSSGGGGSPPTPSVASHGSQLWAVAPDSEDAVPLVIYPPGMDTNGLTIFSASPSEVQSLRPSFSRAKSTVVMDSGITLPAASPAPSPQPAPTTPQRPPNNPVNGVAGTFGIGYDTYTANGTNPISFLPVPDEPGVTGSYVALNNYPASVSLKYGPLPQYKIEANNFINEMQLWGWQCNINESDSQLNYYSLMGSGNPFNQVNLGVLMSHGAYGTSSDYQAGLCEQMYFPITSNGQYLRLSQMNLGGSGTNGLEWFAIMACDSLLQHNWSSMQSHGIKPYNSNLHLLLGTDSICYVSYTLMQYWAQYMNNGKGAYFKPLTIHDAWYAAATDAYYGHNYTNTIIFSVAGDSACTGDYVQPGSNSSPQGSWTYDSKQVWPPQ